MSCDTWYIYIIADPADRIVRYVGATIDVKARLKQHSAAARSDITPPSPVSRWIRSVLESERMPVITHIDWCATKQEAATRERQWIAAYRKSGAPLTNVHPKERKQGDFMKVILRVPWEVESALWKKTAAGHTTYEEYIIAAIRSRLASEARKEGRKHESELQISLWEERRREEEMKGSEAAGLSVRGTQDGLAALSNAGTERRCEKPNQQEGFLQ